MRQQHKWRTGEGRDAEKSKWRRRPGMLVDGGRAEELVGHTICQEGIYGLASGLGLSYCLVLLLFFFFFFSSSVLLL